MLHDWSPWFRELVDEIDTGRKTRSWFSVCFRCGSIRAAGRTKPTDFVYEDKLTCDEYVINSVMNS